MAKSFYNQFLDKIVESGAAGNQAYIAHFVKWDGINYERLYQAEGNEVTLAPVTKEVNLIGMKQKSTMVTGYNISTQFSVVVEKNDPNYESVWDFARRMPTGGSANVDYLIGFFMDSEHITVAPQHERYFALKFRAAANVGSISADDEGGTISISFDTAGDIVTGAMESSDIASKSQVPIFIPATDIPITSISLAKPSQASGVTVALGETVAIPLVFLPKFVSEQVNLTIGDSEVCSAESIRDFVEVTGLIDGETTLTIASAYDPTKSVAVDITSGAGA